MQLPHEVPVASLVLMQVPDEAELQGLSSSRWTEAGSRAA